MLSDALAVHVVDRAILARQLAAKARKRERFKVPGRDHGRDVTTGFVQLADAGNVDPGSRRLAGRLQHRVELVEDPDGGVAPTLFVHTRCGRLIETLPVLQHDPNRPENVLKVDADEDGVGGDNAADALRYLVATKAREIRVMRLRGL